MKKYNILLALSFLIALTISCNSDKIKKEEATNTYTIEGEIEGLGNNHLYYQVPGKTYNRELGYWADSIIVTNGKFSFKDTINEYTLIKFSTRIKELQKTTKRGGWYPVSSASLNLILYPGATINVTGKVSDFMEAYPSGDPINNDLGKLHKEIFPIMNDAVNYSVKATFEEDENIQKELNKKGDSTSAIANEIKKNFVMNNPSSFTALYYLSDMMMRDQIDHEDAIATYNKLDKSFADISFYKDIAYRVAAINSTKEGSIAPILKTTSTLDGTEFDLTSYRGKYVMIDFWGIWCGPCVAEMPKVKEFLEKYSDKLEVLGVNSGDKKERIIDFTTKNNYAWQQIMDVRDSDTDNFVLKYNVNAFPTKFILDPEGKIVKKFVGSGEEAFELLEELLK